MLRPAHGRPTDTTRGTLALVLAVAAVLTTLAACTGARDEAARSLSERPSASEERSDEVVAEAVAPESAAEEGIDVLHSATDAEGGAEAGQETEGDGVATSGAASDASSASPSDASDTSNESEASDASALDAAPAGATTSQEDDGAEGEAGGPATAAGESQAEGAASPGEEAASTSADDGSEAPAAGSEDSSSEDAAGASSGGSGAPGDADAAPPPVVAADGTTIERPPGWQPEDPRAHPLSIERLRGVDFPGSDLVVVEQLPAGAGYDRAVATYQSEGLTIRGLLTVPHGEPPATGWPVILFNHGYIPPAQYRTTERYVAYQDAFARNGYITYKSDYRGHGSSEGEPASSRGEPAYLADVLNAMASVARRPDADAERVGMWGHSMGGLITLRAMVVSPRIKAGVIWAGVVASYPDLYHNIGRAPSARRWTTRSGRRSWRLDLVERFGTPEENPEAWGALSANAFLADISGPLQLHHGTADSSVPVIQSTRLQEQMEAAGRPSELFVYEGDDHNLSGSLATALARSVAFLDAHVKGGG